MNFYRPVSNTRCHSIEHKMRIARIKIRIDSQGRWESALGRERNFEKVCFESGTATLVVVFPQHISVVYITSENWHLVGASQYTLGLGPGKPMIFGCQCKPVSISQYKS